MVLGNWRRLKKNGNTGKKKLEFMGKVSRFRKGKLHQLKPPLSISERLRKELGGGSVNTATRKGEKLQPAVAFNAFRKLKKV